MTAYRGAHRRSRGRAELRKQPGGGALVGCDSTRLLTQLGSPFSRSHSLSTILLSKGSFPDCTLLPDSAEGARAKGSFATYRVECCLRRADRARVNLDPASRVSKGSTPGSYTSRG